MNLLQTLLKSLQCTDCTSPRGYCFLSSKLELQFTGTHFTVCAGNQRNNQMLRDLNVYLYSHTEASYSLEDFPRLVFAYLMVV